MQQVQSCRSVISEIRLKETSKLQRRPAMFRLAIQPCAVKSAQFLTDLLVCRQQTCYCFPDGTSTSLLGELKDSIWAPTCILPVMYDIAYSTGNVHSCHPLTQPCTLHISGGHGPDLHPEARMWAMIWQSLLLRLWTGLCSAVVHCLKLVDNTEQQAAVCNTPLIDICQGALSLCDKSEADFKWSKRRCTSAPAASSATCSP